MFLHSHTSNVHRVLPTRFFASESERRVGKPDHVPNRSPLFLFTLSSQAYVIVREMQALLESVKTSAESKNRTMAACIESALAQVQQHMYAVR